MTNIEARLAEIKRAVAAFTTHSALLALIKGPDSDSERLEIHLLDVPSKDSFRAMDEMVDHLIDAFGDLSWLVFTHSPEASRVVRQRFQGRAQVVTPSLKSTIESFLRSNEALEATLQATTIRRIVWPTDLGTTPAIRAIHEVHNQRLLLRTSEALEASVQATKIRPIVWALDTVHTQKLVHWTGSEKLVAQWDVSAVLEAFCPPIGVIVNPASQYTSMSPLPPHGIAA